MMDRLEHLTGQSIKQHVIVKRVRRSQILKKITTPLEAMHTA